MEERQISGGNVCDVASALQRVEAYAQARQRALVLLEVLEDFERGWQVGERLARRAD
jgi:hypothetical protein